MEKEVNNEGFFPHNNGLFRNFAVFESYNQLFGCLRKVTKCVHLMYPACDFAVAVGVFERMRLALHSIFQL